MDKRIKNTIENLERNGFSVEYFETSKDAKSALLTDIKKNETVGFGGSMTLTNMGVYEDLVAQGNTAYYHGRAKSPEERKNIIKNAATADVYLSSSNAITEDGRLINIDGAGNRLSSMLFGHKRLYIVAGINKVVKNYEEAIIRIKNVTCPQNTDRLDCNTPCRNTGKCANCDSPQRICNATLIMERQMYGAHTIIYLINENLGY
ncbi:lactate utilization protein [Anaerovorax odorimutans]|uniref:lactate utilization protein n=1 Tax=Anaerovorax odorimutans TaxID=109327 RepID=UPI00042A283D|nr:lactate utilization protein [Anaerovorax odorimutans]